MSGNPFDAYFAEMKEDILSGVADLLKPTQAQPLDFASHGIEPLRAYSAKEVAEMLGVPVNQETGKRRVGSVSEIPETELPRVRRAKGVGYLGINILCYMLKLEPVDVAAAVEQYRAQLERDRPTIQPLHPLEGNKRRIV